MAKVQVLNVAVLDNPSPFGNPFQFEITFECMEDLPEGKCRYIPVADVSFVGVTTQKAHVIQRFIVWLYYRKLT